MVLINIEFLVGLNHIELKRPSAETNTNESLVPTTEHFVKSTGETEEGRQNFCSVVSESINPIYRISFIELEAEGDPLRISLQIEDQQISEHGCSS